MSADHELAALLRSLDPVHRPGAFVFASVDEVPDGVSPIATVVEDEGTTLVLEQGGADELGLSYAIVFGMITLHVRSPLDAVGLTAAVASALAALEIACNVVAGHYHDHVFVPVEEVDAALDALRALSH